MIYPSDESLLLHALDMVVFERMPDGSLVPAGRPPAWFERLYPSSGSDPSRSELTTAVPFLESFLLDADQFWASSRGSLYAGQWVQSDIDGFDRNIEAWAANAGARDFLILRLLGVEFEVTRRALQKLRASNLADELSTTERKPGSAFQELAGLWFVRCCLGLFSVASLAIFTLQGFRLWEFELGSNIMNWVGLLGLASVAGLVLLAMVAVRTPHHG
jgi:hypothetical protein